MEDKDRRKMMELSERYLEQLQIAETTGTLQIVTGAMAHALQAQLSIPCRSIRHAGALDNIMRAVAHTIEGKAEMNKYVLEKLGHGHDCLRSWMAQETV